MRLSTLQTIVENATGYTGGPAVDVMPDLGLDECVGMLPVVIMESQIEMSKLRSDNITALTEAAGNAIMYGTPVDFTPIVENAWDSLKAKVAAFFKKVGDFIKSIIAKLRVYMDRVFKTGQQLYDKYKDKPEYRGKDPKDLTCSGYEFEHGDKIFAHDATEYADVGSIGELFNAAVGSTVTNPTEAMAKIDAVKGGRGSDDDGVLDKEISEIHDISSAARQSKMAQFIVGSNFDLPEESSWAGTVKKELWGEKKEIKYGEGPFTKTWIEALLSKPVGIDNVIKKYEKMQNAATKFERDLNKILTDTEKRINSAKSDADKAANKESNLDTQRGMKDKIDRQMNVANDGLAYMRAYIELVHDAYGCISTLQGIETDYVKARNAQAKTFFGKILSWNQNKDNNDAGDSDELTLLEVEL